MSLRVSLLGLGRAGRFHLQSLLELPQAKLAAVYDVQPERAQQIAQQRDCRAAESADEAIELADAVIVATPTATHYDYVELALQAGKAVLSEKPLGSTLQQIDHLFALAEMRKLPLFVAYQRRFDPTFAALVKAVHAGDIGQLQFVRSISRDNPVPSADYIRTSGGIFHDCIVHDLDMICHMTRSQPTHVAAFGSSFLPEIGGVGDFDNVAATLAFPGGILASIDANRRSVYGYDQRIEAFGDRGMLQAENQHPTSLVRSTHAATSRDPIEYSFPTRYRAAYRDELACFVRCAAGEQSVPITHADVRWNFILADALERSARSEQIVAIELPR